mmetsp:Transcript_31153/g.77912  ORF Transcript_31153/g.77912 Transcript_31153/m.77912 type:complete len:229 (+) Transcript_31153:493-1179(+)
MLRPHTLVVVLAAALPTAKLESLFPGSRVLHASSVDVARLRRELQVDAAVRAREAEREKFLSALNARGETGGGGAAPAPVAEPAVPAHSELLPNAIHPSYFIRGPEHIISLAASHTSEHWAGALTASLELALTGLETDADERKICCLTAVLGAQMLGSENLLQSIDVLKSKSQLSLNALPPAQTQAAQRSQAEAAQTSAAGVFTAGVRANLTAVMSQLHPVADAGQDN